MAHGAAAAGARRREGGRLLVEVVVAFGIASVALLGLASTLPVAMKASALARERALARAAADRRLAEIASLDEIGFRRAFADGAAAPLLTFHVFGLDAPPPERFVGHVTIVPAPGTPDFDGAALFEVHVECAWAGFTGPGAVRIQTLVHPSPQSGGAP